jgi:hypothetical protein
MNSQNIPMATLNQQTVNACLRKLTRNAAAAKPVKTLTSAAVHPSLR